MTLAGDLNSQESSSEEQEDDYSSDEADVTNKRSNRRRNKKKQDKRPYQQVKHIFEITVKELKNIPILAKFIREA